MGNKNTKDNILPLDKLKNLKGVNGRIKEIATRKGTTLTAIAKKVGLSQSQLTKINSGASAVTLEQIKKIANALDVRFVELIELDEGYGYTTDKNGEINGIIDLNSF